jgi:LCP family protein required for cell wall assembly
MRKKQIGILIAIGILFVLFAYMQIKPYYIFTTQTLGISPFRVLLNQPQPKSSDGVVNVLILGKPDIENYGPNLTDSIIVASYDMKDNTVMTIGIPRDIWSPTLRDKINSAYAYGEAKKAGGGVLLAKAEVEDLLNIPIHYTAVINFSKFQKLIDVIGGIEVTVERSFTDTRFPIKGKENDECFGYKDYECRYKTVSFDAGKMKMDGETALTFARSRNAEGEEGSDFARSKRQQLVFNAVQKKLRETAKTGDIALFTELYQSLNKLIERDITNEEAAVLARRIVLDGEIKQATVQIPDAFFIVPDFEDYDGKYVLLPKDQDKLNTFLACIFEKKNTDACYTPEVTRTEQ